jgi:glycolate oxidase FAD binding subunit
LWIRLAGAKAAVEAAILKMQTQLPAQRVDPSEANLFWESMREQTHPFFIDSSVPLWRFAVNPLSKPFATEHPTIIEWLGGQRWIKADLSPAKAHELASDHQGYATLFRYNHTTNSVFTPMTANPLTAPLAIVQQRLRQTFDPHGIFQTGRMPL